MKFILLLFLILNVSTSAQYVYSKCHFNDGHKLEFKKTACTSSVHAEIEKQGCYSYSLYKKNELITSDEAARILKVSDEMNEGEAIFVTYTSEPVEMKRIFGISLEGNEAYYLDPNFFDSGLKGVCY